jgi:predicted MFS family arabinose efflux permease
VNDGGVIPGEDEAGTSPQHPESSPTTLPPWRILCGLMISGFLLALPGGLLPLWGYHIRPDFGTAANFFAFLGTGLVCGSGLGIRLSQKYRLNRLLAGGCFGGALALLLLAAGAPPARLWFQALSLFLTGASAGIINTAILESLAPAWEADPARIALTGGMFFGAGSVCAAWLMSQCLDSASAPRLIAASAMAPGIAGVLLGRLPLQRHSRMWLPMSEAVKDLRTVMAILFALLLFFQFASEWSIAGWLPVFLIDRLGLSPERAVLLLALYWFALMAGRVVTARLLSAVRHSRLLGASAFCALFGCIALLAAGTTMGVVVAILLIGAGFSAIYPLAAERIATRFSYYHPGYFNGIFTFAMLGGIFAPFLVGYMASWAGLRVVPLAAMVGSCAVFALVLLIWLGRKVSGS